MHAGLVIFFRQGSVQKLHRLSFTSKMQHNCLVYFLEIVFPYGRGKASLNVYLKELSVHSRMSDLIRHRRETHAHSLEKSPDLHVELSHPSVQVSDSSPHLFHLIHYFVTAKWTWQRLIQRCTLIAPLRREISPSPNSFKYSSEESDDRVLKAASLSHSELSLSSLIHDIPLNSAQRWKRKHISFPLLTKYAYNFAT